MAKGLLYFTHTLSKRRLLQIGFITLGLSLSGGLYWNFSNTQQQLANYSVELESYYTKTTQLQKNNVSLATEQASLSGVLDKLTLDYEGLKAQDQYVINQALEQTITQIEKTYPQVVDIYEQLLKLKEIIKETEPFDKRFTGTLLLLADRNYASASANLTSLGQDIQTERNKIASGFSIPANVANSNTAPGSGFARQVVQNEIGSFLVDIVGGGLDAVRVIVDTASAGDCGNDCPVLSLADYVSRNGAFAGINGAYFCPASYPSCAGKTNSFDTLLMNKDKAYFNSDNNKYSTVPAVIFGGSYIRFVGQSLEWGRDTSIDSMIANQGLLLSGGAITFGGDGDPKKGSRGSRSFVANKGNNVYIGVVHNATVAEVAHVLKTLGMEGALNLDSGGSTALWFGGYKVGPGRALPNAILFVRK